MPKAKRRPVSKQLRFEVFKRDQFECQYCGSHPPAAILHVDHIIAVKHGGENNIDNLVTACDQCNLGKGSTPLTAVPQSLSQRAAETREREKQIRGYAEAMAEKRRRLSADAWAIAELFMDYYCQKDDRTILRRYFQSIKTFVDKLGFPATLDAMERACDRGFDSSRCFRYFCGICWNHVREQSGAGGA